VGIDRLITFAAPKIIVHISWVLNGSTKILLNAKGVRPDEYPSSIFATRLIYSMQRSGNEDLCNRKVRLYDSKIYRIC
jgi:hypothetical protein